MASDKEITVQTVRFFWECIRRYPRYIAGFILSLPLAVLAYQILPPFILARVLSRLAHGDFQPHHIWASFGSSLIAYALVLLGSMVFWRLVDALDWQLEGLVQRDIAQRVFRHLLLQGANFHANRFGGSLVSQTNKLLGA